MQKLTVFSTLVFTTALLVACNDGKSIVAEPTPAAPSGVSAEIKVDAAVTDPGGSDFGCRAFAVPLHLTIRTGDERISLTDISMRFVSSSSAPEPGPQALPPAPLPIAPAPPTAPAPIPTVQFGSSLIEARSFAIFPLSFPIGCLSNPRGTMIVVVGTRDGRGRAGSIEARSELR